MLTKDEAIIRLNELGRHRQPFSFYCDFLGEKWCIQTAIDSVTSPVAFSLQIGNNQPTPCSQKLVFEKHPISFQNFQKAFNEVVHQINIGNSFLTNLTFQTPIQTNLSLEEIFERSHAKYKLLVPNQFVVFSPEIFVKIKDGNIYSYPMKGTIDAEIPYAAEKILADSKEKAEHITIVDLIRNDLSQIAKNVTVTKFRYIDELNTNQKKLLQVSSEIRGSLEQNWQDQIGHLLSKLLPAGSISGAPKRETIKIIKSAETFDRGFYTGICGHFDGEALDTGVMIRFIKQEHGQLLYCSGGGITSFSEVEKEYQEMIDKIYLAF